MRVLFLEDNIDLAEMIIEILQDEFKGIKITHFTNGLDGFNSLSDRPYDLVITDNIMPVMNGVSFVKNVRLNNCEIPIIFFTDDLYIHNKITSEMKISKIILKDTRELLEYLSNRFMSVHSVGVSKGVL